MATGRGSVGGSVPKGGVQEPGERRVDELRGYMQLVVVQTLKPGNAVLHTRHRNCA
jgi:hypothetical protein